MECVRFFDKLFEILKIFIIIVYIFFIILLKYAENTGIF